MLNISLNIFLKYILPNEDRIRKGLFDFTTIETLFNWDTISGLQFENIVLNNIGTVLDALNVPVREMIQYGPYFQTKTKAREGCQVDLMVLCKRDYLYLCELKFKNRIGMEVVDEMEEKIRKLKLPRSISVRPVLVYSGTLTSDLSRSDYFSKILNFEELLG